jgi:hypothetical protein
MNPQRYAHPRAGMAIGAVLLVGWFGAIGAAIATDDSGDPSRTGRAGPGYLPPASVR